jgi:4-hydroxy-tetrahydrodipicolinate synthase
LSLPKTQFFQKFVVKTKNPFIFLKKHNRRSILKAGLLGSTALAASSLANLAPAQGQLPNAPLNKKTRSRNWKEWAKANFRGVENETIPSFTPDFSRLNQRAVRLDVQQAIRHGFISTLCSSEVGLTANEAKEFISTAVDAAQGKILVSTSAVFNSFDRNFEIVDYAAKAGCSHVLVGYPPNFNPRTANEVFDITKRMCEIVDIGIILYPKFDFSKIDPAAIVEILKDLVKLPNVFAVKIYDDPVFYPACVKAFGSEVLIASPNPATLVKNVQENRQQWIGAGPYEAFQTPNQPYFVQMLNAALQGDFARASGILNAIAPALDNFFVHHATEIDFKISIT